MEWGGLIWSFIHPVLSNITTRKKKSCKSVKIPETESKVITFVTGGTDKEGI